MYNDSNREVTNPFLVDERPEYLRDANAGNINNVNSLQQIDNNYNVGNANNISRNTIATNPFLVDERPEYLRDKSEEKDENNKINNQNTIVNPFLVDEKPDFLQNTSASNINKVNTILQANKNQENVKAGDAEKINSVNTVLGIKNKPTMNNLNNQENIFLSNDKGSQISLIASMVNNTEEMQDIVNATTTQNNGSLFEEQQNVLNTKGFVGLLREEGIEVHNNDISFTDNVKFNDTSISDLNVEGDYNNLNVEKYKQEEKVMQNLEMNANKNEKKTVNISAELRLVFMIVAGLFIFTLIMPFINELLFG